MERFQEKVAIVTGGANGIGKAMATRLIKEGAQVVIADVEKDTLEQVCADLGPAATGIVTDVRRRDQVAAMVQQVMARHGRVDVLFNNAGICAYNLFLEENEENWDLNFNTNVKGVFNVGQAVARVMAKQGTGGVIINTSSVSAEIISPTVSAYAASKAAIMQLTRVMALELAEYNIRVNAIGPGPTITRMTAKSRSNPERMKMFLSKFVDQRFGEPEEIASVALFLASDEASFATGGMYFIDGGYRVQ